MSKTKERITLEDAAESAIIKLVEGNPGALSVCVGFLQRYPNGLLHLLKLDANRVYGPRIWMAWKDVCYSDPEIFDNLLIQGKLEEVIQEKCRENEYFEKEWHYYGHSQE